MSSDDISNAELARRLDAFRRDVHDDLADISRRMDSYVLREVYQAERAAMLTQLDALTKRVDAGETQRRTAVLWLIGAVLVPAVVLVAQVILQLQGPR